MIISRFIVVVTREIKNDNYNKIRKLCFFLKIFIDIIRTVVRGKGDRRPRRMHIPGRKNAKRILDFNGTEITI